MAWIIDKDHIADPDAAPVAAQAAAHEGRARRGLEAPASTRPPHRRPRQSGWHKYLIDLVDRGRMSRYVFCANFNRRASGRVHPIEGR
jgi:hypothetical protein